MVNSGADIQPEAGYVRIHPAILELLATADLTASEFKCVLYLLRKTYGWGKKEDALSYGQIAEATKLSRRGVINAMQALVDKKVVRVGETKIGRNGCRVYGFNKYFEQWSGVLNGEAQFTISDNGNSEPQDTIKPGNSELQFTIKPEMVNHSSLEMVNRSSPTIDKKEKHATTAVVGVVEQTPEARKYGAFVTMLEQVFAVTISPVHGDFVAEWVNAVTEREWVYALGECKARKGGQFVPKYIASILRRVVAERIPGEPADVVVVVDVAKPEVNAWPI